MTTTTLINLTVKLCLPLDIDTSDETSELLAQARSLDATTEMEDTGLD